MTLRTAGRILVSVVAAWGAIGAFLFDWNETHVYNPAWPPHAKFHNAQTLAMGVSLGVSAVFFTWRRAGGPRTNALAAAIFAETYYATQFVANEFPGVAWTDPEFLKDGQTLDRRLPPQRRVDIVATALIALGTACAWPRDAAG